AALFLVFFGVGIAVMAAGIAAKRAVSEGYFQVDALSFVLYFVLTIAAGYVSPGRQSRGAAKLARILVSFPLFIAAMAFGFALIGYSPFGWFICAAPGIAIVLFSRDFKEVRKQAKQDRREAEFIWKLVLFVWFWAFHLIVPILLGPAMCLSNFLARFIHGFTVLRDDGAQSLGEERREAEIEEYGEYVADPKRSLTDRMTDAGDQLIQWAKSQPKYMHAEVKRDECGRLMIREEGTTAWREATDGLSDGDIEIDGERFQSDRNLPDKYSNGSTTATLSLK
ncbi:MAG: hypothetical protein FWE62_03780, partial [Firmicutes bacterium]|nr:hypothetical protein [Bacillota bacterium]